VTSYSWLCLLHDRTYLGLLYLGVPLLEYHSLEQLKIPADQECHPSTIKNTTVWRPDNLGLFVL